MKKLLAIGLTICCLPTGLAAEDQSEAFLGTVNVLVIEDSTPSRDMLCAGAGERSECMAFNRAVLTARIQKVSALHERGRWM
jgi:hypothetical protein